MRNSSTGRKHEKRKFSARYNGLASRGVWDAILIVVDPTVRESAKAEEVILPGIRFLTQDELDSLRANAEELKKKFEQDSWTKTR